jgi:hypothetical protein
MAAAVEGDVQIPQERNHEEVQLPQGPEIDPQQQQQPPAAIALQEMATNPNKELEVLYLSWVYFYR